MQGFRRGVQLLLEVYRKARPSLQQMAVEWCWHLCARWHVAQPLLLALVPLPGKIALCGCRLRLLARGAGFALVMTIRRAQPWPLRRMELPFRP